MTRLGDIYLVTGFRLHDDEKLIVVEMEPWDEPVENPQHSQLEDLKRTLSKSGDPATMTLGQMLIPFIVSPSIKPSHPRELNVIMVLTRDGIERDGITVGTKVQLHISKFEE